MAPRSRARKRNLEAHHILKEFSRGENLQGMGDRICKETDQSRDGVSVKSGLSLIPSGEDSPDRAVSL